MPAVNSFTKRRSFSLGRDHFPPNAVSPWARLPKPGVHSRRIGRPNAQHHWNAQRTSEAPSVESAQASHGSWALQFGVFA
jgi:hypothetical protein